MRSALRPFVMGCRRLGDRKRSQNSLAATCARCLVVVSLNSYDLSNTYAFVCVSVASQSPHNPVPLLDLRLSDSTQCIHGPGHNDEISPFDLFFAPHDLPKRADRINDRSSGWIRHEC